MFDGGEAALALVESPLATSASESELASSSFATISTDSADSAWSLELVACFWRLAARNSRGEESAEDEIAAEVEGLAESLSGFDLLRVTRAGVTVGELGTGGRVEGSWIADFGTRTISKGVRKWVSWGSWGGDLYWGVKSEGEKLSVGGKEAKELGWWELCDKSRSSVRNESLTGARLAGELADDLGHAPGSARLEPSALPHGPLLNNEPDHSFSPLEPESSCEAGRPIGAARARQGVPTTNRLLDPTHPIYVSQRNKVD